MIHTSAEQCRFKTTSNGTAPELNWKFENMKSGHSFPLTLLMQKHVPVGKTFNFLNLYTEVQSYN